MVISAAGVELTSPEEDGNEAARFIDEHGPGLYALSLRVVDPGAAETELAEQGVEPPELRRCTGHPCGVGPLHAAATG